MRLSLIILCCGLRSFWELSTYSIANHEDRTAKINQIQEGEGFRRM